MLQYALYLLLVASQLKDTTPASIYGDTGKLGEVVKDGMEIYPDDLTAGQRVMELVQQQKAAQENAELTSSSATIGPAMTEDNLQKNEGGMNTLYSGDAEAIIGGGRLPGEEGSILPRYGTEDQQRPEVVELPIESKEGEGDSSQQSHRESTAGRAEVDNNQERMPESTEIIPLNDGVEETISQESGMVEQSDQILLGSQANQSGTQEQSQDEPSPISLEEQSGTSPTSNEVKKLENTPESSIGENAGGDGNLEYTTQNVGQENSENTSESMAAQNGEEDERLENSQSSSPQNQENSSLMESNTTQQNEIEYSNSENNSKNSNTENSVGHESSEYTTADSAIQEKELESTESSSESRAVQNGEEDEGLKNTSESSGPQNYEEYSSLPVSSTTLQHEGGYGSSESTPIRSDTQILDEYKNSKYNNADSIIPEKERDSSEDTSESRATQNGEDVSLQTSSESSSPQNYGEQPSSPASSNTQQNEGEYYNSENTLERSDTQNVGGQVNLKYTSVDSIILKKEMESPKNTSESRAAQNGEEGEGLKNTSESSGPQNYEEYSSLPVSSTTLQNEGGYGSSESTPIRSDTQILDEYKNSKYNNADSIIPEKERDSSEDTSESRATPNGEDVSLQTSSESSSPQNYGEQPSSPVSSNTQQNEGEYYNSENTLERSDTQNVGGQVNLKFTSVDSIILKKEMESPKNTSESRAAQNGEEDEPIDNSSGGSSPQNEEEYPSSPVSSTTHNVRDHENLEYTSESPLTQKVEDGNMDIAEQNIMTETVGDKDRQEDATRSPTLKQVEGQRSTTQELDDKQEKKILERTEGTEKLTDIFSEKQDADRSQGNTRVVREAHPLVYGLEEGKPSQASPEINTYLREETYSTNNNEIYDTETPDSVEVNDNVLKQNLGKGLTGFSRNINDNDLLEQRNEDFSQETEVSNEDEATSDAKGRQLEQIVERAIGMYMNELGNKMPLVQSDSLNAYESIQEDNNNNNNGEGYVPTTIRRTREALPSKELEDSMSIQSETSTEKSTNDIEVEINKVADTSPITKSGSIASDKDTENMLTKLEPIHKMLHETVNSTRIEPPTGETLIDNDSVQSNELEEDDLPGRSDVKEEGTVEENYSKQAGETSKEPGPESEDITMLTAALTEADKPPSEIQNNVTDIPSVVDNIPQVIPIFEVFDSANLNNSKIMQVNDMKEETVIEHGKNNRTLVTDSPSNKNISYEIINQESSPKNDATEIQGGIVNLLRIINGTESNYRNELDNGNDKAMNLDQEIKQEKNSRNTPPMVSREGTEGEREVNHKNDESLAAKDNVAGHKDTMEYSGPDIEDEVSGKRHTFVDDSIIAGYKQSHYSNPIEGTKLNKTEYDAGGEKFGSETTEKTGRENKGVSVTTDLNNGTAENYNSASADTSVEEEEKDFSITDSMTKESNKYDENRTEKESYVTSDTSMGTTGNYVTTPADTLIEEVNDSSITENIIEDTSKYDENGTENIGFPVLSESRNGTSEASVVILNEEERGPSMAETIKDTDKPVNLNEEIYAGNAENVMHEAPVFEIGKVPDLDTPEKEVINQDKLTQENRRDELTCKEFELRKHRTEPEDIKIGESTIFPNEAQNNSSVLGFLGGLLAQISSFLGLS